MWCYEQTSKDEDDIVDEEFNMLFNELADSECDMTVEYIDFDVEICSSLPTINSNMSKLVWPNMPEKNAVI